MGQLANKKLIVNYSTEQTQEQTQIRNHKTSHKL
jgi:hypothetical protein